MSDFLPVTAAVFSGGYPASVHLFVVGLTPVGSSEAIEVLAQMTEHAPGQYHATLEAEAGDYRPELLLKDSGWEFAVSVGETDDSVSDSIDVGPRQVHLIVEETPRGRVNSSHRLRILNVYASEVPLEIFSHAQRIVHEESAKYDEDFCFVASPIDLEVYPSHAPDLSQQPAYYRKSLVDVILPNATISDQVKKRILREADNLVASLNRRETLTQSQVDSKLISGESS